MKTVLLSLLLLSNIFAITAKEYAPTVNALTNLNFAYAKAKKENKEMILLMVIKDGCHWCEKMVEETLPQKGIQEALSNTIIVLTDFNSELSKQYKAKETPSLYFIDAKSKKVLYEQIGYEKPGSFMITIHSALDNLQ
jgi:thioredoxin-related protein